MTAIAGIGILLSTITRNSAAAVVGTLMVSIFIQIIGSISALDALDPYLLSTQFNAWQGILREPTDWAPIVRSAWVCALYALPAGVLGADRVPAKGRGRRLTPCWHGGRSPAVRQRAALPARPGDAVRI